MSSRRTSALASILVTTVLVADQVIALRTVRQRSRATAVQAAIVLSQAARASSAVTAARDGVGEATSASDEVRSYATMPLTAAPVLLDSRMAQAFLETAQHLAAELTPTRAAVTGAAGGSGADPAHLDDAVDQLRQASSPLTHILDPEQLRATGFWPDSPAGS